MTHDWSHLDKSAAIGITKDGHKVYELAERIGRDARQAILSAITPSDLAALLAEKCPGWVAVPINPNVAMIGAGDEWARDGECHDTWDAMLTSSPKLGEDN